MAPAPRPARALVALAAAVFASRAGAALAQGTGTPLERFEPAPAGDSFFSLPTADVTSRLRPGIALAWSYAHDPLVVASAASGGGGKQVTIVDHQATLHTLVSLELARRFKLDLDVPVTFSQSGDTGGFGGSTLPAPRGSAINDLRLGLRGVLLRQDGAIPAAAIGFSVWAPTGSSNAYTGSGSARYAPFVAVGAEYRRWLWGATFSRRFQTGSNAGGDLLGSEVLGGAGVALKIDQLQIGPELFGSTVVDDRAATSAQIRTGGAEALLGARYLLGPFSIGAGAGGGIGRGAGTPGYRLFAELTFAPSLAPKSGWLKEPERAPDAVKPVARAAPPPAVAPAVDTDGDGVPDAEDLCPTVIGDPRPTATRRGCPPDRDGDGIPDADDRCPDEPGVENADPAKNGCPLDSDGDGIPNMDDACPSEPGKPTKDIKTNGCPAQVRLEGTQIVILDQVHFATGRDEIQKDSFGLLGQVAGVFQSHPELARVAVDGHTDNVGSDKGNLTLSEKRAVAVVEWLVAHGVDARRLEARGFGLRRPLADNRKPEGRAKNRRVEFQILRRTPDGEAGWKDGPLE